MAKKPETIKFAGRTLTATVRESRHMTKAKAELVSLPAQIVIPDDTKWEHKPAQDGRPEMWRAQVNNVEVWLHEMSDKELKAAGEAQVAIKVNRVTKNGRSKDYLYLQVTKLEADTEVSYQIVIRDRPLKQHNPMADAWLVRKGGSQSIGVLDLHGEPAEVLPPLNTARTGKRRNRSEVFPFAVVTWNGEGRPDAQIAQLTREIGDGAYSLQSMFQGRQLLIITVPGVHSDVLGREVREALTSDDGLREGKILHWSAS